MLFTCPYASKVWDLASLASGANILTVLNFQEGWERVRKIPSLPPMGIEAGTLAASIIWSLWRSRNNIIFEKRKFTPEETLQKALTDAREWIRAQPLPNQKISKPLIRLEPIPRNPDLHRCCMEPLYGGCRAWLGYWWSGLPIPTLSGWNFSFIAPHGRNVGGSHRHDLCPLLQIRVHHHLLWFADTDQPNHKEDDEPRDLWSIEGYLPSIYRF